MEVLCGSTSPEPLVSYWHKPSPVRSCTHEHSWTLSTLYGRHSHQEAFRHFPSDTLRMRSSHCEWVSQTTNGYQSNVRWPTSTFQVLCRFGHDGKWISDTLTRSKQVTRFLPKCLSHWFNFTQLSWVSFHQIWLISTNLASEQAHWDSITCLRLEAWDSMFVRCQVASFVTFYVANRLVYIIGKEVKLSRLWLWS